MPSDLATMLRELSSRIASGPATIVVGDAVRLRDVGIACNALPALEAYVEAADALRNEFIEPSMEVRRRYDTARAALAEQIGGGK